MSDTTVLRTAAETTALWRAYTRQYPDATLQQAADALGTTRTALDKALERARHTTDEPPELDPATWGDYPTPGPTENPWLVARCLRLEADRYSLNPTTLHIACRLRAAATHLEEQP